MGLVGRVCGEREGCGGQRVREDVGMIGLGEDRRW